MDINLNTGIISILQKKYQYEELSFDDLVFLTSLFYITLILFFNHVFYFFSHFYNKTFL